MKKIIFLICIIGMMMVSCSSQRIEKERPKVETAVIIMSVTGALYWISSFSNSMNKKNEY